MGRKRKTPNSTSKISPKAPKGKITKTAPVTESLSDHSTKTEQDNRISSVVELENKTTVSEEISSGSSSKISPRTFKKKSTRISETKSVINLSAGASFELPCDEISNAANVETTTTHGDQNSSGTSKISLRTSKRISTRTSETTSLVDLSARTELFDRIPNAAELETGTVHSDENSSKVPSRNSKKKSTGKTSITQALADLSAENTSCDEISNACVLENTDVYKNLVPSKTFTDFGWPNLTGESGFGWPNPTGGESDFGWPNLTGESDFFKKAEENNMKSSTKPTNQSSELISNFRSIIDELKSMKIEPSVHIYSITSEGQGMSAVDVSQDLSHVAYSFTHSRDVNICARNSLSDGITTNDLGTTWSNFLSARNKFDEAVKSGKGQAECLSSPQQYVIGHNKDVSGLCFSSDNNILMSCSLDGYAKAINLSTYRVLEHYDGHELFTGIDVNSHVTRFATINALSCAPFHAAYLYTFERKSPLQRFTGHEGSLKCIRFHPNGLYFATAALDKCIKLWNIHQSKEVRLFKDKKIGDPKKLTFSPDGKYIAAAYDKCIQIWDIASSKKVKCLDISDSDRKLRCSDTSNSDACNINVCYNLDGSMLAAGGSDKKIRFWNITYDESSEKAPEYDFLKSETVKENIFSIKYISSFFSIVTG